LNPTTAYYVHILGGGSRGGGLYDNSTKGIFFHKKIVSRAGLKNLFFALLNK